MTTVEVMATGYVPPVIDSGGQAEIVRPLVDSYRWRTLPELVALTRALVGDPAPHARIGGGPCEAPGVSPATSSRRGQAPS